MKRTTAASKKFTHDDVPSFLVKIRSYPMLSAEEEADCIDRWQKKSDQDALRTLVTSHLRLAAKTAHGYRRYGIPIEDLISEGCVGMIQAIDRFDPEKGFRLATYAKWWIRAAVQEYIMRSWSMVRIGTTVGQKKLFFNLRRLKSDLCDAQGTQLSIEDVEIITDQLNVSAHEVISMDCRMSSNDLSLNETVNQEDAFEWQDRLMDERDDQETVYGDTEELQYQRHLLARALADLPDRDSSNGELRRIGQPWVNSARSSRFRPNGCVRSSTVYSSRSRTRFSRPTWPGNTHRKRMPTRSGPLP